MSKVVSDIGFRNIEHKPYVLSGSLLYVRNTNTKVFIHEDKIINLLNNEITLMPNSLINDVTFSSDNIYMAYTVGTNHHCASTFYVKYVNGGDLFQKIIYYVNQIKWCDKDKKFYICMKNEKYSFCPETGEYERIDLDSIVLNNQLDQFYVKWNTNYTAMTYYNWAEGRSELYMINNGSLELVHTFLCKVHYEAWNNDQTKVIIVYERDKYSQNKNIEIFDITTMKISIKKSIIYDDWVLSWSPNDKFILMSYYYKTNRFKILCSETMEKICDYLGEFPIWSNCGKYISYYLNPNRHLPFAEQPINPESRILTVKPPLHYDHDIIKHWFLYVEWITESEILNDKLNGNISDVIMQHLGIFDKKFKYIKGSIDLNDDILTINPNKIGII